jgi:hypothetical protein
MGANNKEYYEWKAAIKRAIARRDNGKNPIALELLAEKLLKKCDQGDIPALREFGDRIDGRATEHKIIEHRSALDDMKADELLEFSRAIARLAERGADQCDDGIGEKEAGPIQTQH